MSRLVVEVCEISEVKSHPGADLLELAIIRGWQCVVKKGTFQAKQKVVYFPPDTVLSQEWTDKFGVTNYCNKKEQGMRIRQAKLRGEPSFGLVIESPDPSWEVGKDVADFYGAQKYDPPVLGHAGDILGQGHILFEKFTDIENMRNFPDVFEEGEEVICTEKIHGTQTRISLINDEHEGQTIFCGSKEHARKRPDTEEGMKSNFYWFPYTLESVQNVLSVLGSAHKVVEIFGETFGRVQNLRYGINGIAFRAFGLRVDGLFLDYDGRVALFERYGVPMVPLLWRGPFSLAKIKQISEGKTTIPGADHIREGTVVQPVHERRDPKIGRVILKYVSDTYLGKHSEDDTKDE
jgi:RNA ligase (TIGR02306 family)